MRLLLAFNKVASALFLLFSCFPMHADTVITNVSTTFGSVVSLQDETIEFQTGCSGPKIAVSWADVLVLRFDKQCTPHEAHPPTAPLQVCKESLVHVLKLRYRGRFVYLRTVSMSPDHDLRGVPYGKHGGITMHRKDVDYIQPTDVCPSAISQLELPKELCLEPEQFAVNWSVDPVFNNQVFTKGFAIYVKSNQLMADGLAQEIRRAFSTALTLWASTLEEHKDELPQDLRFYVEHSTARGKHLLLYAPPQVIQVACQENATLIVDWVARQSGAFPKHEGYVARAQLQGRTILLNANENKFGYPVNLVSPLAPGTANLISIFVHELGHCLGLPDDTSDPTSVMNPNYVAGVINQTVAPSRADFVRFRTSLEASIRGTAPGFFDVKDCAGLRTKASVFRPYFHKSRFSNLRSVVCCGSDQHVNMNYPAHFEQSVYASIKKLYQILLFCSSTSRCVGGSSHPNLAVDFRGNFERELALFCL